MASDEKRIQHLLRAEVAEKGVVASIAFAFFGTIIFFYHFNSVHYTLPIKIASVLVILVSGFRFYLSREIEKKTGQENYWQKLRWAVWLNSIGWGVIFGFGSLELVAIGIDYAILILLLVSFVTSSLVTLAYDRWLFYPFQLLTLVPAAVVAFYHGMILGNPSYCILGVCFVFAVFYQIRQFRTFHDALLKRYKYQIELENSYQALKESQDALISQTVKLIHASKVSALGDMAGGLSHEVNNSLMVILGAIQQLERYIHTDYGRKPTYEEKISMARGAINKIKSVVDGLRFFSQQMDPAPKEETALEEIIQRTLNFCFEFIKAHAIRLEIDPIPAVHIFCQPIQITQILFNLLKNAFDAIEKASDEKNKWIRISFTLRSSEVDIIVSNGGPKISTSVASKIFQPFFTTKDVGKGTGLSLSISKGIARDHSGDLNLDEEQEFTTFVLTLPLKMLISPQRTST